MCLVGAAGLMHASPILYTITFSGGSTSPIGSFDFDPTASTNPFSAFDVTIGTVTYDFTINANFPSNPNACGGTSGPQSIFNYLTSTGAGCGVRSWTYSYTSSNVLYIQTYSNGFLIPDVVPPPPHPALLITETGTYLT